MNIFIIIIKVIYYGVIQFRNYLYDRRILRTRRVSVPVVSVGNLSFGGTGKTPLVMWIAHKIHQAGYTVVILSRGYKRKSFFVKIVSDTEQVRTTRRRAGDEPYLMAHRLKGIPVIVSRNRVRGAKKAIKQFEPDVIILDDGFQHRKLARNADIVLIDSPNIFNNRILLREPLKNISRAHAVVFTKYNFYENAEEIHKQMIKKFSCPVFYSYYTPLYIANDTEQLPARVLENANVWLFAGIGKPDYFIFTVEQAGARIEKTFFYRDHAHYSRRRVRKIINSFNASSADYIITTEKDWHKIKQWVPVGSRFFYVGIDVTLNRSGLLLKLIYNLTHLKKRSEEDVESGVLHPV